MLVNCRNLCSDRALCLVSFFKHAWPVFFGGSMEYLKLCKSSYGFKEQPC